MTMRKKSQKDGEEPKLSSNSKDSKNIRKNSSSKEIPELDTAMHFSTSLNEDLEELLEKDTKRFFGGCGG